MDQKTSRIHLLPTPLANQIAAGEVVERPASVVKELLENSLDAGARAIDINIEKGGLQLIQITDDGCGIEKDDLRLALQRHTTSKIHSFTDLEHVQSLGFRGEALASIASVARLSLISKAVGSDTAWQVQADGGLIAETLLPAAQPVGTRVEIRDLFYNTPARRKFLRSESTEFHHIEEVMKRLALSTMQVSFSLRHNQRKVLQLPLADNPASQAERIAKVCGQDFIEQAVSFDTANGSVRLSGWLGLPSFSRNQADIQFFYVNGRSIRDKLVNHAIRQAFQDYLPNERYPGYVLYLEIEPQEIDVNVHPTKHEIRFRNSRWVHDFLWQALRRVLTGETTGESLGQDVKNQTNNSQFSPRNASFTAQKDYHHQVREQQAFYRQGLTAEMPLFPEPPDLSNGVHGLQENKLGKPVAYLHQRYLLLENATGLAILHIPTAQKWLVYQRFLSTAQTSHQSENITSQPLLVPVSYTATTEQLAKFNSYQSELQKLGFVIERLGATSIVIRRAPSWLRDAHFEPLLANLVKHCQQHNFELSTVIGVLAESHGLALPSDLTHAQYLLSDLQQYLSAQQWQQCMKQITLHELETELARGKTVCQI